MSYQSVEPRYRLLGDSAYEISAGRCTGKDYSSRVNVQFVGMLLTLFKDGKSALSVHVRRLVQNLPNSKHPTNHLQRKGMNNQVPFVPQVSEGSYASSHMIPIHSVVHRDHHAAILYTDRPVHDFLNRMSSHYPASPMCDKEQR